MRPSLPLVVFFAATLQAQEAPRPNIVLIMADDMGWSDLGCFGSEIETPNLDALAANGLRLTQFYNAARCCPTRASLLTGLYPHQAGIGHMTSESVGQSSDWGVPSYRGYLAEESVTLAEALSGAGYRTLMAGKWHVGTFEGMWPTDRGFDRFFGMIRGASNFWRPSPDKLVLDQTTPIEPHADFFATDDFTDGAIRLVEEADARDDDQPFFLYMAYTAPHWPVHARPSDTARYRWRYLDGWDAMREQRLQRGKELGIVTDAWKLSPSDAPEWSELSPAKRDELDLRMALYAAQVDNMDQNIGRLVRRLEHLGELENTLILFIVDNGACAEGGRLGGGSITQLDTREGYWLTYGGAWANASNTPFRRYKHWVHEGGIAASSIAHWPEGIPARGDLLPQLGHLIDLMPTFLDLAGGTYPTERDGRAVPPMEGVSLVPALTSGEAFERGLVFWEHEGNRAVRDGDWKLVAVHDKPWELYDLATDRSETADLAAQHPEVVARLIAAHDTWAERCGVLPWKPIRPEGYAPPAREYPATWKDRMK